MVLRLVPLGQYLLFSGNWKSQVSNPTGFGALQRLRTIGSVRYLHSVEPVPEGRPHTVRSCAQAKDPQLINRIALVNDISIVAPRRVLGSLAIELDSLICDLSPK